MKKTLLLLVILFLGMVSTNAQKVLAEKAVTVKEGGYTWFNYSFSETTRIKGRFRAQGGSRNDIQMMIMDSDNFENWRNGNESRSYYNSGRVTVANFNVNLAEGDYVLVFNNSWSILTPKAVTLWFYE